MENYPQLQDFKISKKEIGLVLNSAIGSLSWLLKIPKVKLGPQRN